MMVYVFSRQNNELFIYRFFHKAGLTLFCVCLLAVLAGGLTWLFSQSAELNTLKQASAHRIDIYSANLSREIDKYAFFPATLMLQSNIKNLLSRKNEATVAEVEAINHYLEQLNQLAGTLVIYLLDQSGQVIATSNWRESDSFMREDLSWRAYFSEVASGGASHFFGVGSTRDEAGYYLSAPLINAQRLQGVAVIKVSLDQLERSWESVDQPVLVTDENGIIILSSVPSWKFTALQALPEAERNRLALSLQYGSKRLQPLGLQYKKQLQGEGGIINLPHSLATDFPEVPGSGEFLLQSQSLTDTGWKLTVLSPSNDLAEKALVQSALAAVITILLCVVLLFWNQRRRYIRERLRAREKLQLAHDDLERKVEERTRNLQATQNELLHAGRLAVIGQLSTELSHELSQPLTALSTLAGNTIKYMDSNKWGAAKENLKRIDQLIETMKSLTNRLKLFARKSFNKYETVVVRQVIENTLCLLAARIQNQGVTVSIQVQNEGLIKCDSDRLQQVLVNLVVNALDALEGCDDPHLDINAVVSADVLVVIVQDNGEGFSANVLEHLFEPFFTTKKADSGLGLGLAIAAGIVSDTGGILTAVNNPAGGACFTLEIPIFQADEII